jgi:hypothetical protein
MTFKELDAVVLTRDLPDAGLREGDLGSVVHVYAPSLLEVEFVRGSGETHALVQIPPSDIRPLAEEDVPAVRSAPRRAGGNY